MNWVTGEDDESTGSRPRRLLWIGTTVALLIVAGAALVWWSWQSRLGGRIAEIRARGEPLSLAELDAYFARPPVAADATALWLSAGERLNAGVAKAGAIRKKLSFLGEAPEPPLPGVAWEELELSRQFLAENAQAMRTLRDAAALGGRARYLNTLGPDWITMLLPHIQTLRTSARALQLEANVCAHSGDAHGAADAIHVGLVLASSLENEPLMVSQLVRAAIFGVMTHELKRLLPLVDFADEDLDRIEADLAQSDFAVAAKRGLIGERAGGLANFGNPGGLGLNGWQVALSHVVRGADEGLYLEVMTEYVAATEMPWPEMLAASDALGAELKNRLTPFHIMTSNLVPALNAFTNAMARCETDRRLTIIAIALERYRRRMGCPLAELAALVPEYLGEVPADPTTGDPFRYRTDDVGYVVYSPSLRFPTSEPLDPETGANPLLLFRYPPQPEKPREWETEMPANDEEAADEAVPENNDVPRTDGVQPPELNADEEATQPPA